jgi:DNA polymerase I-like protein with 3'-5' exonuclease and polymerase domains
MLDLINTEKLVCLDIETTGLDRHRNDITSIQIGFTSTETSKYTRKFFDWNRLGAKRQLKLMKKLKECKLVTHNGKFDLLFLYEKTGVSLNLHIDTLVLAHICGEEDLTLKGLTRKYFHVDYDISKQAKTGVITDELKSYALDDVLYPMKLMKIFKGKVRKEELFRVFKHEMRAYKAYFEIEKGGVPISPKRHEVLEKLQEDLRPYKEKLLFYGDINWNSNEQVASILFTKKDEPVYRQDGERLDDTFKVTEKTVDGKSIELGEFSTRKEANAFKKEYVEKNPYIFKVSVNLQKHFKPVVIGYGQGLKVMERTEKGAPSVGIDTLSNYVGNECVDTLLEYKRISKLITFIESWESLQVDGRIYPSFNITARTGRTTCSNPNIQQCPQDSYVRNLIEARPGWKLAELDYSQLELRVASWLAGDENMQHAYQSGSDLHSKTTELLFGDTSGLSPEEAKRKRTQSKSCFSGDTEILTENGFVEFRMYDGVTPVAQYNIESQEISYTQPTDFRMIPNQKICVFENENTSLKLTPDHECIIQVQNGKKYMKKVPFKDLAGHGQSKYAWVNAGYYKYDESKFIDDDLTRLIACFVADGSYSETKAQIKFGFTKKRKIDRFRELIERIGIEYEEKVQGKLNISYFTISDFRYVSLMKRYCDVNKDLFKPALTELNPLVYLEEASHWDGHVNHTKLIQISSTSLKTIEYMQIMATQSGVRARLYKCKDERDNVSDTWLLSYNLGKSPLSRFESRNIDLRTHHNTNHNVYCVTVPEHNIVIRHNGKVSIQGNCNFGFLYGMVAKTFIAYAKGYGLDLTQEDSEKIRADFFNAYPTLLTWHEECKDYARTYGYIKSPIGRKRWFKNIHSNNFALRSADERQAINSPVQGFGSDLCTSALADIVFSEELDHSRFNVLGSVHDAILFEIRDDYVDELVPVLKEMMENPSILEGLEKPIPIIADVEVSQCWGGH